MNVKLTNKLYKCKVTYISTISEEELYLLGVYTEVNEYNESIEGYGQEYITVMITISKMIDIYIKGDPIYLCDRTKVPEIYEHLESYINSIKSGYAASLNAVNTSDDRLNDIERFCSEILGYNKVNIVKSTLNATHGFGMGFQPLTPKPTLRINTKNVGKKVGVLDGYVGDYDDSLYTQSLPNIDLNKIKRGSNKKRTVIKRKQND